MGLILGIVGSIAGAAYAAIKLFGAWRSRGTADDHTRVVRQTTGVVMNIAAGIRGVLDALHLIAPRQFSSSKPVRLRIGRTIEEEEEALP